MIDGQGEVHFIYGYRQLLGGEHSEIFKGSLGPVASYKRPISNVEHLSGVIGRYLSENGVRGVVGTDFVVVDENIAEGESPLDEFGEKKVKVYAIENNVRNTGTSYPLMTIRNFLGYNLAGKTIKSYDDVAIPELNYSEVRETVFRQLLPALATHSLNLNRETGEGCLVHLETARLGKLGVVCVANSPERVQKLFDAYTKMIRRFVESRVQVQQLIRFNQIRRNPAIKGKEFTNSDFVRDENGNILTDKDNTVSVKTVSSTDVTEQSTWTEDFSFTDDTSLIESNQSIFIEEDQAETIQSTVAEEEKQGFFQN